MLINHGNLYYRHKVSQVNHGNLYFRHKVFQVGHGSRDCAQSIRIIFSACALNEKQKGQFYLER